jgi:hypothetical protein
MEENVSEQIGVDSLERTPKGPLTRHVELLTLTPDAEGISVDAVVRELRLSAKSAIARSPLQLRHHCKCRNRQNRRKAVT